MNTSFTPKQLRATLTLPGATFPGTGNNTLVLTGLRMTSTLTGIFNWTNFCDLTIFGMKQADMNAVTVLYAGPNRTAVENRANILLEANDGNSGWKTVFNGQFQQAAPNYHNAPDVCLTVYAAANGKSQVASAAPNSWTGATQLSDIVQQLSTAMGVTFELNGATGTIQTPYLTGSLMTQLRKVCAALGVDYGFTSQGGLIVTPKNTGRTNQTTVQLNKSSGLIGYPTLQQYGVNVQVLFNPAVELGTPVQIDSDVPGANGLWYPYKFVHQLDAQKPGGSWFSSLDCSQFGVAA